ncbi:MAG: DJ-1/PfpI family protein [Bacilli bacterium]|nr:DJ-1/PfpI family protein [Bacilli bacterium]
MEEIRGLILLADGCEEVEAIATHDILTRAGIKVDMVSTKDCHRIHTSMGLTIKVEKNLKEIENPYSYDFIVLPGGKLGVQNLEKNRRVQNIIESYKEQDKLICAICAAPSILGNKGYLDNKKYVCFPSFERGKGFYQEDKGVVVEEKLITGRSMFFTIPFAEEIVKYFLGEEGVKKIQQGTRGIRC